MSGVPPSFCVVWGSRQLVAVVVMGVAAAVTGCGAVPAPVVPAPLVPAPVVPAPGGTPPGVPAVAQRATVTRHTDGDTLRLLARSAGAALVVGRETRVRLLEIDAPESVHPGRPDECFGAESAERLQALLPLGSSVWVVADRELLDRHDRTLLYVWDDGGTFVNLALVRGGYATAVLFEPNDRHIAAMRAAERQARVAGRGLWSACRSP